MTARQLLNVARLFLTAWPMHDEKPYFCSGSACQDHYFQLFRGNWSYLAPRLTSSAGYAVPDKTLLRAPSGHKTLHNLAVPERAR